MSSTALFQPITIGDQRPIAVDVTPSDDATVSSATFTVVRRADAPTAPPWLTGSCEVDVLNGAFRLTTASLVSFPTVDTYTVQYSIVWSDGQVDNTVAAVIPVFPLRH